MKIFYSDEDAIKIEQVFYRLNDRNTQEGRAVRATADFTKKGASFAPALKML